MLRPGPAERPRRSGRGTRELLIVLAVTGLSIATGCSDDQGSGDTPTTVSAASASTPGVTDADRGDTAPADGPPVPLSLIHI